MNAWVRNPLELRGQQEEKELQNRTCDLLCRSQRCCVKAPMFCFFSREGVGRGLFPEDERLEF